MIHIYDQKGNVIHRSRNLRGVRDHARRVGVILATAYPAEHGRGDLSVIFGDGATCNTQFNSYRVACEWLHARRSWRGCRSINGADLF